MQIRLRMSSRIRLLVGGSLTYVAAVAVGYSYSISRKPPGCHCGEVKLADSDRQQLYAQNAKMYDSGKHTTILQILTMIKYIHEYSF